MNHPRTLIRITGLALLISAVAGSPAWAANHQGGRGGHGDHGKQMAQAATGDMTDGEVHKLDKDGGKLTLKDGDMKNLDMPGMTMVFVVRDMTINDAGKFTVTAMHMAQYAASCPPKV